MTRLALIGLGNQNRVRFGLMLFWGSIFIASSATYAQNPFDQIVGGAINPARSQQAAAEWQKTSPLLKSCFNVALQRNRTNINGLAQQGIGPNDPRVAQIKQGCEQFTDKKFRQNFECMLTAPNGSTISTLCDESFALQAPNGTVQKITVEEAMRQSAANRRVVIGQFERKDAIERRQQVITPVLPRSQQQHIVQQQSNNERHPANRDWPTPPQASTSERQASLLPEAANPTSHNNGAARQRVIWNETQIQKLAGSFHGEDWSNVGKNTFSFSGNGELIAVVEDGYGPYVSLFEVSSGRLIKKIMTNNRVYNFTSVSISRDGNYLLTGNQLNGITLWEIKSGNPLWSKILDDVQSEIRNVSISPDAKIVAAANSAEIKIYSFENGAEISLIRPPGAKSVGALRVRNFEFSPDSTKVAWIENRFQPQGVVRVSNPYTGEVIWEKSLEADCCLAFTRDGSRLANITNAERGAIVTILSVTDGAIIKSHERHRKEETSSGNGTAVSDIQFGDDRDTLYVRTWRRGVVFERWEIGDRFSAQALIAVTGSLSATQEFPFKISTDQQKVDQSTLAIRGIFIGEKDSRISIFLRYSHQYPRDAVFGREQAKSIVNQFGVKTWNRGN